MKPDYFVHPAAIVGKNAQIGKGTKVWHFSRIVDGVRIGDNCNLGQNVYVGTNVVIGNNVKIQNNVSVYSAVTLEDNVFCGPSCVFTNITNPRSEFPRNSERFYLNTRVKKGASIGANATIVCGHTIGSYAFIGAGAVVTKDVADYALVYGNPARMRGWVCRCGEKLKFSDKDIAACYACGRSFKKENNKVEEVLTKESDLVTERKDV